MKNGGEAAILHPLVPRHFDCHPERSEGSHLKNVSLNSTNLVKPQKNEYDQIPLAKTHPNRETLCGCNRYTDCRNSNTLAFRH